MANKRKRSVKEVPSAPAKRPKSDGGASAKAKLLADRRPFAPAQDMKRDDHERERSLYKLLGSPDVEDRIAAGDVIVSCLLGGDGADEAVLRRHLERRLFQGLASGNDAARIGFSYVLVEIVRQLVGDKNLAASKYPGLGFDALLGMLVEKTTPTGNLPGQEERNYYWGRIFGFRCFIQADVLFHDRERWLSVLRLLIQLAQKKVWLRQQCGIVIAQSVPKLKRKAVEKTLEEFAGAGLAKSPEGLGIWIAAMGQLPDKKLPKPWPEPLGTKSLQDVAGILKGSTLESGDDDGSAPNQGNISVLFVWDLILAHFMKPEHSKDFKVFWDRVVDQSLYSKSATPFQKSSGFKIFQKVLETCWSSPPVFQSVFSQHLMACLMNQSSSDERELHRAALKSLKAVESAVAQHPELLLRVLKQLLGEHGAYNFDERTKTKTVDKLLRSVQAEDASALLDLLSTNVKGAVSGEGSDKPLRVYADYVSKLVSAGADSKDRDENEAGSSVGAVALAELAKLAYSGPEAGLTEQTRKSLRGRLAASFAKVLRRPEDFQYLCDAILAVNPDDLDMDDEVQSELVDALEKLQKLVKPGKKESDAMQAPRQGLALLYAVAILQLYNEEPDALDVLGDIKQCYEKLRRKQKDKSSSGDSGMSEFLVEILLSLVSQPSSLMRQASLLVFEAFTPLMSSNALELLTDPLAAKENEEGQKALFNTGEEDEDMDDDDGDDDEEGLSDIGSDVEFVDLQNVGEEDSGSNAGEESDEDDQSEEEEGGEDDDKADLDDGLAKILGTHRLDKDAEAESSDDDADMTDSEMMALDEKMSEFFKHRVKGNNKRKERKDAKESVVNFKHRILDLLAVYVKREAAGDNSMLAFGLLLPLLQLMRTSSKKPLVDKACGIIVDLSKHRKKAKTKKNKGNSSDGAAEDEQGKDDVVANVDELVALLEEIHAEASRGQSNVFARAVSSASLAIVSALSAVGAADGLDRAIGVYAATQRAWILGEATTHVSFFNDWLNWGQAHAQNVKAKTTT